MRSRAKAHIAQTRIEEALRTGARSLDLSDLELGALPESLGNLTGLTSLILGSNGLAELPESLGNLTALTNLDVAHNDLSTLPDSLGDMTRLTDLGLGHNRLTALPDSLGNLAFLRYLNLGGNHLTALPDSLGNPTRFRTVDLRGNAFTALPDDWAARVTAHDAQATGASCPVGCLRLPDALYKLLTRAQGAPFDPPRTVGDVARLHEQQRLREIKGLGPSRISQIEEALASAGLTTRAD